MNIYTKQKQTHKHTKQTWLSKGKDGQAGINQEHGINRYILHKVDKQQGFAVQLKELCSQTVVLAKTLENPLDSKEIKSVNPKGNQP